MMVVMSGRSEYGFAPRARTACAGLLAWSLAAAMCATAVSASTLVRVQGTVTGRKGVALRGVEVSLEQEASGKARRTSTGPDGAFSIDAVETGHYRLRLRYRDTDASGPVEITEDQRIDVALDIDP